MLAAAGFWAPGGFSAGLLASGLDSGLVAVCCLDYAFLAASGLDSGLLAGSGLNFVSAQQIKIQAELFPNASPNLILQKKSTNSRSPPVGPMLLYMIYIYVYVYICMYVCIYMYICVCIYIYVCVRVYTYLM